MRKGAYEEIVGNLARKIGLEHVSQSSKFVPMTKMYLGFSSGFDKSLKERTFHADELAYEGYALTGWDGRPGKRVPVIRYVINGLDSSWAFFLILRFLFLDSLDVGGTSTDVSRFDGRYEVVYETTTAGVTVQSPQLDINTVAAGDGSCLTSRNGLLAGPESAGANPGAACYRKGGPLAVTDANLPGRLVADFFPKIFAKSEKGSLDDELRSA
ncbi:hypothetical protein EST38_g3560 [Candolleomyces aberdarensis]|uniref:Hydantoinase A/oxoprolinase domain-containing protein n=1 Tax=Candolleomyces aberdarensis TaxID=2316362 RepID=A0A4Q2DQ43_9AGAR|nr:hypothetical protein EST38_g3560 [Candolleomyces aberdarensis]